MSLPETILWQRIRRGQIGGLQFRRQHPAGPYILDFFCASIRLAIEIDGTTHAGDQQFLHDKRRDAWLRQQGVEVLRIAAADVLRDESLTHVLSYIAQMTAPSTAFGGPPPP